jgi:hypothetical protein
VFSEAVRTVTRETATGDPSSCFLAYRPIIRLQAFLVAPSAATAGG